MATPDVPERIAFWRKLHERLARLANRIDSETQGKILGLEQRKRDLTLFNLAIDSKLTTLRCLEFGEVLRRKRIG
jgi:hypothetical protein